MASFMQSPLPASPQDVKWERWSVTQWGREGKGCSEIALLQPSAGTQLCKCRTRQLGFSNLLSLHCRKQNQFPWKDYLWLVF